MDVESQATLDEVISRLGAKEMELMKAAQSIIRGERVAAIQQLAEVIAQERQVWISAIQVERKALVEAVQRFSDLADCIIEVFDRVLGKAK